jgi:hypothetical protein
MKKKNYEKTYYKTEIYRNKNHENTRFPDYLIRNLVLSDTIHKYIEERIRFNAPIALDVAGFLNDDDDSMTLVLGVPYDSGARKNNTLEKFNKNEENEQW